MFDTVRLQNSVVTLLNTSLFSDRIFYSPNTQFTQLLFSFCFAVVLPTWTRCQQPKTRSESISNHLRNLEVVKTVLVSENTYCQPRVSSCNVCVEGGSVEVEDRQFLIGLLRRSHSVNSSTCVTLTSPETVEGQILHDALADCHIGPAQQTTLC